MSKKEKKDTHSHRGRFVLLCVGVFALAFAASAAFKMTYNPNADLSGVAWDETVGTLHADIPYGDGDAQKLDVYVPADSSKDSYGMVVYLHAGGFTTGDKADDAQMLDRVAVFKAGVMFLAIAPDAQFQPVRQRVHHRDADAVQAT